MVLQIDGECVVMVLYSTFWFCCCDNVKLVTAEPFLVLYRTRFKKSSAAVVAAVKQQLSMAVFICRVQCNTIYTFNSHYTTI